MPRVALSIQQPWAYAILKLGKDVENRTWPTQFRGRVIIHAGKKIDRAALEFFWMGGFKIPAALPTGCLVGEVDVVDCVSAHWLDNQWASGPWCFVLRNPVAYEMPIPARGKLGFFKVEEIDGKANRA